MVSLVMIARILASTIRTMRMNDELSQRRSSLSVTPAPLDAGVLEDVLLMTATPEATAAIETPEATAYPEPTPEATKAAQTVKSTLYHQVGGEALPEMAALREDNHDLVGWLTIDSVLDLPVVYRNNAYYLHRDFYGKASDAGTIFLDENHPFRERTQNLLLHGHNMRDGTMFGRLVQYAQGMDYLKAHPIVEFSSLWKHERYAIFAVCRVSLEPKNERFLNYYSHPTFGSDEEFASYVRTLRLHSMIDIPLDVQPGDALLTLSTCLDEDRLVIVARRQREGETLGELKRIVRLCAPR